MVVLAMDVGYQAEIIAEHGLSPGLPIVDEALADLADPRGALAVGGEKPALHDGAMRHEGRKLVLGGEGHEHLDQLRDGVPRATHDIESDRLDQDNRQAEGV